MCNLQFNGISLLSGLCDMEYVGYDMYLHQCTDPVAMAKTCRSSTECLNQIQFLLSFLYLIMMFETLKHDPMLFLILLDLSAKAKKNPGQCA